MSSGPPRQRPRSQAGPPFEITDRPSTAQSHRGDGSSSTPCRPFGLLDNAGVHASLAPQGTLGSAGDPIQKDVGTDQAQQSVPERIARAQRGEAPPRTTSGRFTATGDALGRGRRHRVH